MFAGPVNIDPLRSFRIYRISRLNRFYDSIDGDWAWEDVRGVGNEIRVFPIPKRPQTWVFSMFAVGTQLGLGLVEEKVTVRHKSKNKLIFHIKFLYFEENHLFLKVKVFQLGH